MSITLREKKAIIALLDSNRRIAIAIDGLQLNTRTHPAQEYRGWKIEQDLERLRAEIEDIAAIVEECGVVDPRHHHYVCTLPAGHRGQHVAGNMVGEPIARWSQQ